MPKKPTPFKGADKPADLGFMMGSFLGIMLAQQGATLEGIETLIDTTPGHFTDEARAAMKVAVCGGASVYMLAKNPPVNDIPPTVI